MINPIAQAFFHDFLTFLLYNYFIEMKALSRFRQIIVICPAKLSLWNDSIVIKIVDHNQEQAPNQLSTLVVDEELAKHLIMSMKLNVVLLRYWFLCYL